MHNPITRLLILALNFFALPIKGEGPFSDVETAFLEVPSAHSAREHLRYITSMPHVAGTFGDSLMSEYVLNVMEDAGIPSVEIYELDVLLNYPSQRPSLSLFAYQPDKDELKPLFEATLSEDLVDGTSDTFWRNHTFHGYSPSGDVMAPIVFANYGRPTDFQALEKAGVSVKGTIVLMRYGRCFRGLKVRNAQKAGAVAALIYSDPAEDGYSVGPTYPNGPWRPAHGVQRGSVQFNSACAGDPMRVDYRYAMRNETLQSICGINDYRDWIPKIPSLPLSYGDARPLLEHLGGPEAKSVFTNFEGGLHGLTYRVGPSLNTVAQLVVRNHEAITTIPNVIGVIPGSLPHEQDMPILLGNHRDAWYVNQSINQYCIAIVDGGTHKLFIFRFRVYGAADPNSGTASLLEVARGLGTLVKDGWKPLRSIFLLSWSGEEYGLLGSTGWGELERDRIKRALAYLNADTMVSGDILKVSTTPALATLWESVLHDLQCHASDHWMNFANPPTGDLRDANSDWKLHESSHKEGILGSGSDYTVFLDHLGIPSLDFQFGKKTTYGQYHSIYDSFDWMTAFGGVDGKPGSSFDYMAFGAKIWGLLALRLAQTEIIALDHVLQASAVWNYTKAIESQRHGIDLSELKNASQEYQKAAMSLQLKCHDSPLDEKMKVVCNERIGLAERHLLSDAGLPGRPWFKHILQAPGMDLGYAAEAFPGIQQALDDRDYDLAQEQVGVAAERVQALADSLLFGEEAA